MGVEGGFQGREIGRLLLRSFIDLVESAETEDTISLEVHKNNARAKKLYESVGFQYLTNTEGILENEYGFQPMLYICSIQ